MMSKFALISAASRRSRFVTLPCRFARVAVAASAFLITSQIVSMPLSALGQSISGSLRGVVSDKTGALLPGGQATLTSIDTNVAYKSEVNARGEYSFSSVPPGTYRLVVTSAGFATATINRVVINLNQAESLPVTLGVDANTVTVEVTGESEQIVTQETAVVGLFTEREIKELPLNGRDYQNLIYLSPGVTRSAGGTGQGSGVVAAGTRPTNNNYLIDGADNNGPVVPSGAAGGANGNIGAVPLDEIAEFTVISANGSAEFGRSSGAVVNVVTKGGTNTIHGTLFEYVRNPKFNTRQWFDPLGFKSALKQNDFGGRFGIPLWKDKSFMAGAYEGYRQRSTASTTLYLPSAELINTVTDPAFKAYLTAFFPSISNGGQAITMANYSQIGAGALTQLRNYTNNLDGDTGFVRFDHNFSDRHQAFLTGTILDGVYGAANSATVPFSGYGETLRPYHFVFGDNLAINSHLFNTARLAVQRTAYAFPGEKPPAAVLNAGMARTAGPYAGKPYVASLADPNGVPTVASLNGVFSTAGTASNFPQGRAANVIVESDALTWERGKHQFKFGAEIHRIQENGYFSNAIRPAVTINDATLAGFEQGAVFSQTQYFYLTGSSNRGFRDWETGFFAEDTWRVTPQLTLEVGLRYEWNPPFTEAKNQLNNAFLLDANNNPQWCTDLPVGTPAMSQIALINPTSFGHKVICSDNNNLAPRIGFSYDATGKGTTILRGGWGYYYDRIFDNVYGNTRFNAPQVAPITSNGSSLPTPTPYFDGTQATGAINTTQVYTGTILDPHLRTPYTQHFNLTVSQELDRNTSFTVGYVGSIGMKLFATENPNFGANFPDAFRPTNAPIAAANAGALVRSQSDITAGIIRGPFGNLSYRTSNATSNFNSMEVTLKRRTSHGLSGQLAYTWAKSMDSISDEIAAGTDSASPQSTNDNLLAPYLAPGSPCPISQVSAATLVASSVTSAGTFLGATQCASGNTALTSATAPNFFVANYVKFRPIGANYGNSSFDVRQRIAVNTVYALPFGRGRMIGGDINTFANEFIGGWGLSSTVDAQTGTPFLITSGVDSNRDGTTNDRVVLTSYTDRNPKLVKNSPLFAGTNISRFQCATTAVDPVTRSKTCADGTGSITFNQGIGIIDPNLRLHRGVLRQPGIFNWDMELAKNFKLYRESNLRFMADGFNVLNHANYNTLGSTLTGSSFARSSTQRAINNTYSRQFQLALKLEF